jgi:hypothetical protein
MNKNTSVIMASVLVAVLAVGIAATSVIQSVLASRDVGFGTEGDRGGNGGAQATGGTATSGAATGQVNTGAGKANTGDWGSGVGQTGGTSNAVGCGHIGGFGSSGNKC